VQRAYSLLTVKAVEDEARVIRGIATTPAVDRVGDIVEPLGVKFSNPMPFLWQHNHDQPIGTVTFDKPTKSGIAFEAKLPRVEEAGTLKDRIDEAWQSIKLGLVRAVSIGFRPLEYAFMSDGGIHFQEIEVYELSAVTIPAQPGAVITSAKAHDPEVLSVIKKFDLGAPAETDRPTPPEDPPIQAEPEEPAASGKTAHVVKLNTPARVRAQPFVINRIVHTR
jgi:HK97 family phage prohead protease